MMKLLLQFLKWRPSESYCLCISYGIQIVSKGCQKCISERFSKGRSLRQATTWIENHENPEHVFKLGNAIYGLKQTPRAWYERLSNFLLENGFTRGKIDNTIFLKK